MILKHILSGACLLGLMAGPAVAQHVHGGVAFHGGFHPGFHPGFVGHPFVHPGFVHTGPRVFFGFGGPVVIGPPYPYPYPYAYPYPYPPPPYPYYPPY